MRSVATARWERETCKDVPVWGGIQADGTGAVANTRTLSSADVQMTGY